jgi:hypothetical protein
VLNIPEDRSKDSFYGRGRRDQIFGPPRARAGTFLVHLGQLPICRLILFHQVTFRRAPFQAAPVSYLGHKNSCPRTSLPMYT